MKGLAVVPIFAMGRIDLLDEHEQEGAAVRRLKTELTRRLNSAA
jgi:hypothetical protein